MDRARRAVFAFPVVLLLLAFPAASSARSFWVSTAAGLRSALVKAATNRQADVINIAAGAYDASDGRFSYLPDAGEQFSLSLVGAGPGATIFNGGADQQMFWIDTRSVTDDSAVTVTIEGIRIRNYNHSGASGPLRILSNDAGTLIETCTFAGNFAAYDGGAVNIESFAGGAVTVSGSIFNNNRAGDASFGGGVMIRTVTGAVALSGNTFSGNASGSGGDGGGAYVDTTGGPVTLNNNTFAGNTADNEGGGAFVTALGAAGVFRNNAFTDNTSATEGGGLYFFGGGALTFVKNRFIGNTAGADGAGAWLRATGAVVLSKSTFRGNTGTGAGAASGGGFYLAGDTGAMAIAGNKIIGNTVDGSTASDGAGGAFVWGGGAVTVERNIIRGNQSGRGPGGLYASFFDSLAVNANTFIGNGGQEGGGLQVYMSGTLTLSNNLFLENHSGSDGGGAMIVSANAPAIANNTFFGNSALGGAGGGIHLEVGDRADFANNIIWQNDAAGEGADAYVDDSGGEPVTVSHNDYGAFYSLCTDTPACTPDVTWDTNIGVTPLFVSTAGTDPLAWDLRLRPASACVDSGDPAAPGVPTRDRVNVPRPLDGDRDGTKSIDRGAYELYRTVTVVSPNGGEEISGGSTSVVSWVAPAAAVTFSVSYSLNGGTTWKPVNAAPVAGSALSWSVPTVAVKRTSLVKVVGFKGDGTVHSSDRSDALFTISP